MTPDLTMLTWTAGITALMWPSYIVAHIINVGVLPALTYQADGTPLPAWAARAKKAHYNAIENLVPFAVLVIVAHLADAANEATAAAAVAFFWARLAHFVLYTAGVPFGRTIAFTIGWLALLRIFWQIIAP